MNSSMKCSCSQPPPWRWSNPRWTDADRRRTNGPPMACSGFARLIVKHIHHTFFLRRDISSSSQVCCACLALPCLSDELLVSAGLTVVRTAWRLSFSSSSVSPCWRVDCRDSKYKFYIHMAVHSREWRFAYSLNRNKTIRQQKKKEKKKRRRVITLWLFAIVYVAAAAVKRSALTVADNANW